MPLMGIQGMMCNSLNEPESQAYNQNGKDGC